MWWVGNKAKLSKDALAFLLDPASTVLLSVVSIWEILIKVQTGKVSFQGSLQGIVSLQQKNGLQVLPVTLDHVLAIGTLPHIHKDPFDRMLIVQAIVEQASVISNDAVFAQYPVKVVW